MNEEETKFDYSFEEELNKANILLLNKERIKFFGIFASVGEKTDLLQ